MRTPGTGRDLSRRARTHRENGRIAPALIALLALTSGCAAATFLHVDRRVLWDDLRVLLGGGGNSTVLLHGTEALVVDPKMLGYAKGLRDEVEVELGRRVRRILLTHSHFDHAGGANEYPDLGAVLVHPRTRARLLEAEEGLCARLPDSARERRSAFARSEPDLFEGVNARGLPLCALPYVEVTRAFVLWLGGEEVHVMNLGSGHTDGDLVAYLPDRKLLIAGDLVLNGFWPRVDPKAGGNLLTLSRTLDRLAELPFEKIVPGHGEIGGREVLEVQRAYLRALEEDVRSAMAAGWSEAEAVERIPLRPGFEGLAPVPGETHSEQVRRMYRAVAEADMKARHD